MSLWNVYYRGSLSSCNYACDYCPFAKTKNTREELLQDQAELEKFVAWVVGRERNPMSILFTPWGEALVHRYYRQALVDLSHSKVVRRVCIQTNLSAPLDMLGEACKTSLALWATYHPGQTTLARFAARCAELDNLGIRYSVGIVGLKEHFDDMECLREVLSPEVYVWVNAYKREKSYYTPDQIERIERVDPYFAINNVRYPSLGRACGAGQTHFTVDGLGDVRRCHFVKDVLFNIYQDEIENFLTARVCPEDSCGCYIGYIHKPELNLQRIYGEDLLARIPLTQKTALR